MHQIEHALPISISMKTYELHLWFADMRAFAHTDMANECLALLSANEKDRLAKIKSSAHKQRFLITRATVRKVLALYLQDVSPQSLIFATNQFGRPLLAENPCHLEFNLSHSNDQLVIGITHTRSLGVDIEFIDRSRDFARIAQHYFHPNEWGSSAMDEPLNTNDDLAERFYRLWTLKEAFIKAESKGLFMPIDSFYFEGQDPCRPNLVIPNRNAPSTKNWVFKHTLLNPEYSVALAVEDIGDHAVIEVVARQYNPLHTYSEIDFTHL